jgi:hypothetical protein
MESDNSMKTLTLLFLFVAAQCFGQPLVHNYFTTNAAPSNGTGLTNLEAPIYIVVQGDSLSSSPGGCALTNLSWPFQLMSNTILLGVSGMTNLATTGDFATNMVNTYTNRARTNIQTAVAQGKTVYWMPYAGINDIDSQYGTNVAFSAISNLWLEGRLDGAKVVAFTIPYNYGLSGSILIDATNYNLMILAATNQWDYLVQPLQVLLQSDSCDNLHYSLEGNIKLAAHVFHSVFEGGVSNIYSTTATIPFLTVSNITSAVTVQGQLTVTNGSRIGVPSLGVIMTNTASATLQLNDSVDNSDGVTLKSSIGIFDSFCQSLDFFDTGGPTYRIIAHKIEAGSASAFLLSSTSTDPFGNEDMGMYAAAAKTVGISNNLVVTGLFTNLGGASIPTNTAAIGTISNITVANATFFTNNLKARVQLVGTIILVAGQTALGTASASAIYNPTIGGTTLAQSLGTTMTFAVAATNQNNIEVSDILGPGDWFQINTSTTGNGSSVSFQQFHFKAF